MKFHTRLQSRDFVVVVLVDQNFIGTRDDDESEKN